ncbi:MAG: esterase family protein [Acidobacteriaceae bacterium]|nr:esterase family protein [Acidobacteriaceae bacterium]
MNREYHKWYSPALQRDMELLVFGHSGAPVMVFPTSMGRFFDYENRGMIRVIGDRFENGQLQAFCVDSVDTESWYNRSVHPKVRAARQNDYDNYLIHELVPFIRSRNHHPEFIATGCSFGGYHTMNFALRHPDVVRYAVSMSGAFDVHQFLNGYYDQNCYFNCPPDFLPNLTDRWFLDEIRRQRLVLATGEKDICLQANKDLSQIMTRKEIPHWLDIWGDGTAHDWPWWERMAVKYLHA